MFLSLGCPVPETLPTQAELDAIKTYTGLLFALPGTPQLWQGQEFGMQSTNGGGITDSTREPLIWSTVGTGLSMKGFNPYNLPSGVAGPSYENIFSTIYSVQPPGPGNNLWEYIRSAAHARRDSPTLKLGAMAKMTLPGDINTDVVVVYDENQTTVTSSELMAFTRTIGDWPVYCIFNFGPTTKTVLYQSNKVMACGDYATNVANVGPGILFSHNITVIPAPTYACQPYEITMPANSSIVFTAVNFFGLTPGPNFENGPLCC